MMLFLETFIRILPNYMLAFCFYLIIARGILGFFFQIEDRFFIWQHVQNLTRPILTIVQFITPSPLQRFQLIFALLYIAILRLGHFFLTSP